MMCRKGLHVSHVGPFFYLVTKFVTSQILLDKKNIFFYIDVQEGTLMRLWHYQLIPHLPCQQLLGQHRECCALRGKGWGKKHATVNKEYYA